MKKKNAGSPPPERKNTDPRRSPSAAGISAVIVLLCLLAAGGALVMSGSSLLSWLGIDTVVQILRGEDGADKAGTFSAESIAAAGSRNTPADLSGPSGSSASSSVSGSSGLSGSRTSAGEHQEQGTVPAEGYSADDLSGQGSPSADSLSGQNAPSADALSGQNAPSADALSGQNASESHIASENSSAESLSATAAALAAALEESEESAPSRKALTKRQERYVENWEDLHGRDFPLNAPLHSYNWKYLDYDEEGGLHYDGDEDYTIRRGIDVSEFQGNIDWDKVKKAGYDFVFVRAGHRTLQTGSLEEDSRAVKNLRRASKAGLDVGVYVFSQAVTEKEAREEAQLCLDVIEESGVEITLPVVLDPEIVFNEYYYYDYYYGYVYYYDDARINYISGEQFTDDALAFSEVIKKAGYIPAVYANCSTETDILDMSRLNGALIWYADYSGTPESPYRFTFWQYSNTGWVDGIPEAATDLNVWFVKNE